MIARQNHTAPDVSARLHSETPVRAVLDTNILVAYALLNGTPARRHDALRRCVERVRADHGLLGSEATLAELRAVLMRRTFDRYSPAAARESFLDAIAREMTLVVAAPIGRLCRDPEDDMFLAAALAADADWLVTVDRQLLSVRQIGRTPIRRPERVLEALA